MNRTEAIQALIEGKVVETTESYRMCDSVYISFRYVSHYQVLECKFDDGKWTKINAWDHFQQSDDFEIIETSQT